MATYGVLVGGIMICAIAAIRVKRLLASALWLAGVSVLVAIFLYSLGAPQIAVIELSVGAGLITVLFIFAISFAADSGAENSIIPKLVAWGLPLIGLALIGGLLLPIPGDVKGAAEQPFAVTLWQERSLDMLVQIGLIFAAALGVVGILTEHTVPTAEPEIPAEQEPEPQDEKEPELV